MKKTGAVLLAAGMSSRMKAFKPMLPYGDSTISMHIVKLMKLMDLDPIVVVTGYQAKELENHLSCAGVRFVRNERFRESQMFDSVKIGIRAVAEECERLMIMPMDLPAIMPETFRQILKIDADMVRTIYDGEPGHPIVIQSPIAEKICEYTGNRGLRGAMENCGYAITNVEVDDQAVRWDVDTPEEYQDLLNWNCKRGNGYPVRPDIQVRLAANDVFFGPGSAELMELIGTTSSIQEACNRIGLSYSKGSRMVKKIENQLGMSIVERWTGGAGGGGSVLTEEGKKLLCQYREMERRVQEAADLIFQECFAEKFWK